MFLHRVTNYTQIGSMFYTLENSSNIEFQSSIRYFDQLKSIILQAYENETIFQSDLNCICNSILANNCTIQTIYQYSHYNPASIFDFEELSQLTIVNFEIANLTQEDFNDICNSMDVICAKLLKVTLVDYNDLRCIASKNC